MGGGKIAHKNKIPNDDGDKRSPLSGTSTSTLEGPWKRRGGSGMGVGGNRHLQIPKSTDGRLQDPSTPKASTGRAEGGERVDSIPPPLHRLGAALGGYTPTWSKVWSNGGKGSQSKVKIG